MVIAFATAVPPTATAPAPVEILKIPPAPTTVTAEAPVPTMFATAAESVVTLIAPAADEEMFIFARLAKLPAAVVFKVKPAPVVLIFKFSTLLIVERPGIVVPAISAFIVSTPAPPSIVSNAESVAAVVASNVSSLAVPTNASEPVVNVKVEPGFATTGIAAVIDALAVVTVDATLVTPVR